MANKTLGQRAYEGYLSETGGVSLVSGAALPSWNQLMPRIQAAWEGAADAVVLHAGLEV